MANKMLIDASHPEETRVVVSRGNRIEEFDFESANKKPLRGNIYLAKVTRVEPSLQAAFVEYGGNRHGFLAFSEIHPDYYQIPVADREALIAEEARAEREHEEEESNGRRGRRPRTRSRGRKSDESLSEDAALPTDSGSEGHVDTEGEAKDTRDSENDHENEDDVAEDDIVEQVGSEDAMEEVPERPRSTRRQYKIQEVIKRRQILLVQVVKEERGNKGAALTTYLSLAGRYSVLMPNTGRGGGISRKITNAVDRKRLKAVASELEVPDGMGIILRTAGASRTKAEIKRDFEYLMRLWENVRELTLQSTAPSLVYEEGSLVKRSIRDLYNKDIDEVIVAGEDAYKDAKDFMRMLMPSHAKNVKPYREPQPLFARYAVEAQLDAMFSNQVTLKSGGYLVINQTEALVSIDVNSGRSTREHNIEDTALKTNLEAADEVARQLRLRDLAGLVVIDFIDMDEKRNNRTVERRLKDALKNDRARIQVGRISPFGLLEMSRQRIRTGVLEGSTVMCPHCAGIGFIRATPSIALHVLRAVEEQLLKSASHDLVVKTRTEIALYILNQKRGHLREIEDRFGVVLTVLADDTKTGMHAYAIERGEPASGIVRASAAVARAEGFEPTEVDEVDEAEDSEIEEAEDERRDSEGRDERRSDADGEGDGNGRRRRRRRRRRGRGDRPESAGGPMPIDAPQPDIDAAPFNGETVEHGEGAEREGESAGGERGSRRRGRRGGRRNRRRFENGVMIEIAEGSPEDEETAAAKTDDMPPETIAVEPSAAEPPPANEAAPKPRRTRKKVVAGEPAVAEVAPPPAAEPPAEAASTAKPRRSRKKAEPSSETTATAEPIGVSSSSPPVPAETPVAEPVVSTAPVVIGIPAEDRPKRGGWWARAKASITGE
jgi:ribonuclease E